MDFHENSMVHKNAAKYVKTLPGICKAQTGGCQLYIGLAIAGSP